MKKESIRVRFKRWWRRLLEDNSTNEKKKSRGTDSSKVKGSSGVQSTLDKLNGK